MEFWWFFVQKKTPRILLNRDGLRVLMLKPWATHSRMPQKTDDETKKITTEKRITHIWKCCLRSTRWIFYQIGTNNIMMIDFELSGNIERIYMLKGHIVSNLQLILAELCVRTNCAELIRLQFLPIFQLNFYA